MCVISSELHQTSLQPETADLGMGAAAGARVEAGCVCSFSSEPQPPALTGADSLGS